MATLLASIAAQASIDAVSASKPNEASSNVSSESGANDEEITVAELQQENEQLRCGVFCLSSACGTRLIAFAVTRTYRMHHAS